MNRVWLPENSEEYLQYLRPYGHTDEDFLRVHFDRLLGTYRQFSSHCSRKEAKVLDIGAHWLHQSLLFALSGHRVTAADFSATFKYESVRKLATDHNIDLLIYDEIASGEALHELHDSSVDVVLFTEILEHITFNPVAFWKEIYRILAPGGRIVVTTPNYYKLLGRAWQWRRFLSGYGGGIGSREILITPTYGHHWKEFSRKEVCQYFRELSPDFHIHRAIEVNSHLVEPRTLPGRMLSWMLPQLYVEVDLVEKRHGIQVEAQW